MFFFWGKVIILNHCLLFFFMHVMATYISVRQVSLCDALQWVPWDSFALYGYKLHKKWNLFYFWKHFFFLGFFNNDWWFVWIFYWLCLFLYSVCLFWFVFMNPCNWTKSMRFVWRNSFCFLLKDVVCQMCSLLCVETQ